MKISLYMDKSIEENADLYFDKAKKAKKKLEGALAALEDSQKKLRKLEAEISSKAADLEEKEKAVQRKRKWFEKFRWFITSTGFLVIAGRDATTNEIIIKKHTKEEDIVFHTSMAGSPFGVLVTEGKAYDEATLKEAAQFVACYSKAWKLGLSMMEVFYVKPDQVSKTPPAGEYIQKGSFMIYGKKTSIVVELKLSVGTSEDGTVMSGPKEAVKANCSRHLDIVPGDQKASATAKRIKAEIGGDLDELIKVVPAGGAKLAR